MTLVTTDVEDTFRRRILVLVSLTPPVADSNRESAGSSSSVVQCAHSRPTGLARVLRQLPGLECVSSDETERVSL